MCLKNIRHKNSQKNSYHMTNNCNFAAKNIYIYN